jgi:hypothetical protein
MNRLTNLTPAEKKFLDDAVAAAERASGKKLNQPNRHIVLNRARAQIESQRYADRQRALREDERQQSDLPGHVRARRAADCAFGGLVVLTLRNHLPFTCVHSHAVAQKSSGAFFRDMVRKGAGNGLRPQKRAEGACGGAGKGCYV